MATYWLHAVINAPLKHRATRIARCGANLIDRRQGALGDQLGVRLREVFVVCR